MREVAGPSFTSYLAIQTAIVASVFVLIFAAPPAQGRMLLVPIDGHARRSMISIAVANGALLVGPGRIPGSFEIEGTRSRLISLLLRNHIIPLATWKTGCGEGLSRQ